MNKINFFVNTIFFAGDFFESKILPGFRAKKGWLVVDLGSGDKPFWRADVFVDKLSMGNEQRFSASGTLKDVGLFVDADITKTPFKDKAFDFSFCSHVLEHVERPDLAIEEIMRISKGGYIEVPDGILEVVAPFHSHLWFIFFNDGQLIFLRKSTTEHNTLMMNNFKYHHLAKHLKNHFIRLYWKGKIKYQIIDGLSSSQKFRSTSETDFPQSLLAQKIALVITKYIRRFFYDNKEESHTNKLIYQKSSFKRQKAGERLK